MSARSTPPIQATYRKGRWTASVNRATIAAPPELLDSRPTGIIATASPTGHLRRSQTAPQERAPSVWSRTARECGRPGSSDSPWAAARPRTTARRKQEKSTTQSRAVRRGRRPEAPASGSSSWTRAEGNSHRRPVNSLGARACSSSVTVGKSTQGTRPTAVPRPDRRPNDREPSTEVAPRWTFGAARRCGHSLSTPCARPAADARGGAARQES